MVSYEAEGRFFIAADCCDPYNFGRPLDAAMEVYNDFNSDLANLFRCVRNRLFALLKELNFFPLNGRDEFNVLKKYLEKEEFTNEYLREELDIAQRFLSEPQFEEIKPIFLENAQMNDVKRRLLSSHPAKLRKRMYQCVNI